MLFRSSMEIYSGGMRIYGCLTDVIFNIIFEIGKSGALDRLGRMDGSLSGLAKADRSAGTDEKYFPGNYRGHGAYRNLCCGSDIIAYFLSADTPPAGNAVNGLWHS